MFKLKTENHMKSKRSHFIDQALCRANEGDLSVFEECFTSDFVFTLPETKLLSICDGSLHGLDAIKHMQMFDSGDKTCWSSVSREIVVEIESEDQTFRIMKWTAKNPDKPYMGINNLSPDLEVVIHVFQLYTFREGKICSDFEAYDTMGYLMDITQRNEGKIIEGIRTILNPENLV